MTPTLPDSDGFGYRDGQLHCEEVPLATLAERFGTPLYVYSRRAIERAYDRYANALIGRRSLVCYAMQANSNLAGARPAGAARSRIRHRLGPICGALSLRRWRRRQ